MGSHRKEKGNNDADVRVMFAMSYRVLSTRLKNVTSEAFSAAASESRGFSALCEALAWATAARPANFAVVVVEEGKGRPVSVRSPEDAARSVV
jgi:hypothetical protein